MSFLHLKLGNSARRIDKNQKIIFMRLTQYFALQMKVTGEIKTEIFAIDTFNQ